MTMTAPPDTSRPGTRHDVPVTPAKGQPEDSYHFAVIRRAIEEIDRADASLTLEDLAARMGFSPAHFQRLFSAWAGVSPKRYQQYLTLAHARQMLAERHSLLDTAQATGLSGTSRLHDLFLRWEAMVPGDVARRGAGLTIRYAYLPSPFGEALAMITPRGICGLAFTSECGRAAAMEDLRARWPEARYHEDHGAVAALVTPVFEQRGETRLHMIGAPFQIQVWQALLAIPSGQVTTYSDIAARVCTPRAARAVGTAAGRNPVSLLIPCHRVLRRDGALGGYHWGLPVKRAMLAREALQAGG